MRDGMVRWAVTMEEARILTVVDLEQGAVVEHSLPVDGLENSLRFTKGFGWRCTYGSSLFRYNREILPAALILLGEKGH